MLPPKIFSSRNLGELVNWTFEFWKLVDAFRDVIMFPECADPKPVSFIDLQRTCCTQAYEMWPRSYFGLWTFSLYTECIDFLSWRGITAMNANDNFMHCNECQLFAAFTTRRITDACWCSDQLLRYRRLPLVVVKHFTSEDNTVNNWCQ